MADETGHGTEAMKHDKDARSLGERVLVAVLWMGGWRWTERLLGFVNVVVIARLLVPEDLGIVATALVVVALFEILIELGTDKYLIRLPEANREDFDTAWTLRLAVIASAAVVIFLSARVIAAYFDEARLVDVLYVLAAAGLLRGFTNIGLTIHRRDLRFDRIALVGLGQRLAGIVASVIFAVVLQNYWAIVLGEVFSRIAEVGLSYLVQPYRPRFSIARIADQWKFSKWVVSRNVAGFAQGRGDQFLVAKFFGVEQMGFYAMALRLAETPTRHLVAPMSMPLYSGLAKKQQEPAQFVSSVLQVIGATAVIVLPAATLAAVLAEPLVLGIFGAKWQSAVPLVAPLVFTMAVAAVAEPAVSTLTLLGHMRLLAMLEWISAIVIFAVMVAAAWLFTIEEFAYARVVLMLVLLGVILAYTGAALQISWRRLLACFYRPLVASVAMAVVTAMVIGMSYGIWVTIALGAALGGMAYIAVAYGLWRVTAAHDAGEALLVRKISQIISRWYARSAATAKK